MKRTNPCKQLYNNMYCPQLKMFTSSWLIKLLTLALVVSVVSAVPQELKLVDNGYEGLVIAISEDIPQDKCRKVINGLKVRTPVFPKVKLINI